MSSEILLSRAGAPYLIASTVCIAGGLARRLTAATSGSATLGNVAAVVGMTLLGSALECADMAGSDRTYFKANVLPATGIFLVPVAAVLFPAALIDLRSV